MAKRLTRLTEPQTSTLPAVLPPLTQNIGPGFKLSIANVGVLTSSEQGSTPICKRLAMAYAELTRNRGIQKSICSSLSTAFELVAFDPIGLSITARLSTEAETMEVKCLGDAQYIEKQNPLASYNARHSGALPTPKPPSLPSMTIRSRLGLA